MPATDVQKFEKLQQRIKEIWQAAILYNYSEQTADKMLGVNVWSSVYHKGMTQRQREFLTGYSRGWNEAHKLLTAISLKYQDIQELKR